MNKLLDIKNKLSIYKDPAQKRAGRNIAIFMAVMLFLTIFSRGTAAATMAKVETESGKRGEIVDEMRGVAGIKAADTIRIDAPEGMKVAEVYVSAGQEISVGDKILRLDYKTLEEKLSREQATLAQLEQERSTLMQETPIDNSAITSAQTNLWWAQEDLNAAYERGDRKIAQAQDELNNAQWRYNDGVTEDYEEINLKSDNLEEVKSAVADEIKSAQRAVETARQGLNEAEANSQNAAKERENTRSENLISAQMKELDIAQQWEKIDRLNLLISAGGDLLSEHAGVAKETAEVGDEISAEAAAATLYDSLGGYEAELTIHKGEAAKLSVGIAVDLSSSKGNSFEQSQGMISAISEPDAEDNCRVKISLPEGNWKSVDSLNVRVVRSKEIFETCIPLGALRSDNSGNYILIVQESVTILGVESVLIRIPVTLEAKDKEMAAISGAVPYDAQIVSGSDKPVNEGDRVRIG